MELVTTAVFYILILAGPISGYRWAINAHRSFGTVIAAGALGGALPGLLLCGVYLLNPTSETLFMTAVSIMPSFLLVSYFVLASLGGAAIAFPFFTAVIGAGIAAAGLLARGIGTWLRRNS